MASDWVLPEEPVPVRLMNTIWADRDGVHDALAATENLEAWLRAIGADDAARGVGEADLERTRRLRDALRTLAAWATDDQRAIAATATEDDLEHALVEINRLAESSPPVARLERDGQTLSTSMHAPGTPVEATLSGIATTAITLLAGQTDTPLRACHAPGCVLYFVKQHPRREWCSAACGNRARVARHYHKHRAEAAGG